MKTIGEPSKPYPSDLNRALLGQNFLPYLLETDIAIHSHSKSRRKMRKLGF